VFNAYCLQADVVLVMEQDRLFTQLSNQLKVGRTQAALLGVVAECVDAVHSLAEQQYLARCTTAWHAGSV
jgi:hypothetical protein